MMSRLIHWAVHARLVVILLALGLMGFGVYSFTHVNVEAYPDPAPPIIEVIAQWPGMSAEEVERQVTIPLEVALAGMPGLDRTRSQSLFELSHLRNQFHYGVDQQLARQEVLNRLQAAQSQLPPGVVPQISPESPTGEILRYTLRNPTDHNGRPVYSLSDLKSLQDWTLERAFRRLPRIADVTSFGGTIKRYEVRPDPARLQRYGVSLQQLKDAISSSNANTGGQYVAQGEAMQVVRGLGLLGQGQDPVDRALAMRDPIAARDYLRAEEERRIREIGRIVVVATNNVPIHVDDLVEGGPSGPGDTDHCPGIVIGHQTRLGRVLVSRPAKDQQGNETHDERGARTWNDNDDAIECIVLLRKGEESFSALRDVNALIDELNNTPGRLLPGVKIERFYDRTDLINVTTETVRENLLAGMGLVAVILLMFLSNVRSALIVAINVPLALLFAFSVLLLRGKSANLLSIGAVDFGIIVDSSVIMVENIYRHFRGGQWADKPVDERILLASTEIQKSLLFSTAIMVCAFLPLFTMAGPEGQIFGPMADTYAFALGGALLLALTLSPVLCSLAFRRPVAGHDNLLVRWLQRSYLWQLRMAMRYRWITLGGFAVIVAATVAVLPWLGREFMPELEEGNIYIRGTFPLNTSLDETTRRVIVARNVIQQHPEVDGIAIQVGRPDDGTDPAGFYNAEIFVALKPERQWPRLDGHRRTSKQRLNLAMNAQLKAALPSVDWNFSQAIRDNVMEALSGVKGENSVKIIGPELAELERAGSDVAQALGQVAGIADPGLFHIMGQFNLAFPVDRRQCARWNVKVADVQDVIATAVGGKALSQMIEGERSFDITLRWPEQLRGHQDAILNIPVDVTGNVVATSGVPSVGGTALTGPVSGPSAAGTSADMPSVTGSRFNAALNDLTKRPRRRLKDLLTIPQDAEGKPDPQGSYVTAGASTIFREQGNRLIAIKFGIRDRDLAGAVAAAQQATAPMVQPPYRLEWSGEFQEMEQAEGRMKLVIPLAVTLVIALLYMAFRSLTDVWIVLSNVLALCCGGVWALLLTGTNFSVSSAVGFISIFGVAVMNGLLLVSSFHRLRLAGSSMEEAIFEGAAQRLRPMLMTTLTAIFGLLPAALSTRIGAQTQRPLAIVVIGGMIAALLLNRYLTPVLYSVFRRRLPDPEAVDLAE